MKDGCGGRNLRKLTLNCPIDQHPLDVLGREHPRSGAIVRLNHLLDAHAMLSGRVAVTQIIDEPASKSSLIVIGVLAPSPPGPACPAKSYDRNLRRRFSFSSCPYFENHQISCVILACSSALVQYFQLIVSDQLELAH
jgi:hypothetical protein